IRMLVSRSRSSRPRISRRGRGSSREPRAGSVARAFRNLRANLFYRVFLCRETPNYSQLSMRLDCDGEAGLLKRALVIREQALGANHPDVGQTLNNLARLYRDQGKYGDAERLFKRALTIREQTLGPSHPYVAATRYDLAALPSGQSRHEEEEAKAEDVTSSAVAQALNGRGLAAWREGKDGEAEGLYKRALAIREKALGANHPNVGQTLNNLALVYLDQGKYSEAEELFKRALAIRETALGANHSDVGQTLNNLALVYRAQDKHDEAEGLLKRA